MGNGNQIKLVEFEDLYKRNNLRIHEIKEREKNFGRVRGESKLLLGKTRYTH